MTPEVEKMTDQELYRLHAVKAGCDLSSERDVLANEIARRQALTARGVALAAERQAVAAERQAESAERSAAATVRYTRYTFWILVAALVTALAGVIIPFVR